MKFPDDGDVGPQPTLPKHTRALELLEMIYRGEFKASPEQMRAAIEALPYEVPKLSVVALDISRTTHSQCAWIVRQIKATAC